MIPVQRASSVFPYLFLLRANLHRLSPLSPALPYLPPYTELKSSLRRYSRSVNGKQHISVHAFPSSGAMCVLAHLSFLLLLLLTQLQFPLSSTILSSCSSYNSTCSSIFSCYVWSTISFSSYYSTPSPSFTSSSSPPLRHFPLPLSSFSSSSS